MSEEKAKYRVLRLSHIHNQLWEEGAEVEYDGEPGGALEPINEAAKAAKKKAELKRGKTRDDEKLAGKDGDGGDGDGEPGGAPSADIAAIRQQYEELFNEKPGNMKAETLQKRIFDKRKELGI
ncbi:hypothetical protein DZA65_03192 [Dickeya dianthicola]|uniref:hypothetical protein n=1 Tax=Dickeya dianthicola TaxID=204039 RepID=UPI000CD444E7|nr:hypothetical protein [Dickeya dianthicola]AYC20067.1 hypothetical protein DZA65_03192 [Dickeya dianthicola]MBI0437116.1 hypothetical protein [Dickeya dianthicola]MBI0448650.1 hypothetical protein [Dickeya dianthicola]MBI0452077.1 hypothetical protein [Dickeya dianthicola]MBI0456345.1 hypothetical protein [Dickeya dianthicola]